MDRMSMNYFKSRRILCIAVGFGILASLLSLFFNDNLGNDTAMYYSRMAQQFIEGNYSRAFFHSIPPLSPFLAGVIGKAGLNGWTAMKVLSGLCFIGAIYWAYRLCRLVLPDKLAQWGALLYVFCPRLIRYGVAGQLDAAKMFLLLFSFERAFHFVKTRKKSALLGAAVGGSLLILARNEGFMYFPLLAGLIFLAEWMSESGDSFWGKVWKGSTRCLLMSVIAGTLCAPWLIYQFKTTGFAVVGSRQRTVLLKQIPFLSPVRMKDCSNAPAPRIRHEARFGKVSREASRQTLATRLTEIARGVYPPYFLTLILALFLLVRHRCWKPEYGWLLSVPLYQIAVDGIFRPLILARFIIPVIPFYFPLLISGGSVFIQKKGPLRGSLRSVTAGAALLFGSATLLFGLSDVRKTLRGNNIEEKRLGLWIRDHAYQLDVLKTDSAESGARHRDYRTGAGLMVASMVPQPAFWAGADLLFPPARSFTSDIHLFFEKLGVDLVVVDAKFKNRFPDFVNHPGLYRKVEVPWEEEKFTLFVYAE